MESQPLYAWWETSLGLHTLDLTRSRLKKFTEKVPISGARAGRVWERGPWRRKAAASSSVGRGTGWARSQVRSSCAADRDCVWAGLGAGCPAARRWRRFGRWRRGCSGGIGVDAAVSEQHQDDADVGAVLQQIGGEAVAEGVSR